MIGANKKVEILPDSIKQLANIERLEKVVAECTDENLLKVYSAQLQKAFRIYNMRRKGDFTIPPPPVTTRKVNTLYSAPHTVKEPIKEYNALATYHAPTAIH